MGVDERTLAKLGPPWASILRPMTIPTPQFLATLHCLLPVHGGTPENWPRAGLEAFAAGVPVVAQNDWGWREMIEHGVTGFLGDCDEELAHHAATFAYDEDLRHKMVQAARAKLVNEFANPEVLAAAGVRLFESVSRARRAACRSPSSGTAPGTSATTSSRLPSNACFLASIRGSTATT